LVELRAICGASAGVGTWCRRGGLAKPWGGN
jgi:hypothetical protein